MTNGTSQGLNIVIAIVIFGIFTLMAYILFEDTLSPALANMFTDVTEKASDGVDKINPSEGGTISDTSPNPTVWDFPSVGITDGTQNETIKFPVHSENKELMGETGPMEVPYHSGTINYFLDNDTYTVVISNPIKILDNDGISKVMYMFRDVEGNEMSHTLKMVEFEGTTTKTFEIPLDILYNHDSQSNEKPEYIDIYFEDSTKAIQSVTLRISVKEKWETVGDEIEPDSSTNSTVWLVPYVLVTADGEPTTESYEVGLNYYEPNGYKGSAQRQVKDTSKIVYEHVAPLIIEDLDGIKSYTYDIYDFEGNVIQTKSETYTSNLPNHLEFNLPNTDETFFENKGPDYFRVTITDSQGHTEYMELHIGLYTGQQ